MDIYCTCKADIPSRQFNAMLALPGNVSGLASRNKIAIEDTVVVPCNKKNSVVEWHCSSLSVLLPVVTQCWRQGYHVTP